LKENALFGKEQSIFYPALKNEIGCSLRICYVEL